jgi:RHS repeat-associated protein
VLRETMGERFVESRYDGTGSRVARKTSLGHETRYQVDGDGALRSVTFGVDPRFGDFSPASLRMGGPPVRAPWRATFERDLLGNETARLLPGGIVSRWRHDEMSRPSEHRIARGNIDVSSVAYQFEAEDEITTLVEHGKGATRFTHDEHAFLVVAIWPDGGVQHRAVDATGNIFKSPDKHDRRYGAGGRLEEAGGMCYVHDADGQLIEKHHPDRRRWLYAWNVRGELLSVTRPDGQRVQFMYDALGRRIRKELGGHATAYVWDGDDVIHEIVEGAPLVTWEFAPGTFALLAKVEGEQRYSVVTDHLGTPETLFDAQGEIAWKAQLDLYGVATEQTAMTACPWRWPGQHEDPETGLYYNRFRYYDPALGRYISQDPLGLHAGFALYAYVGDPLSELDPLGLIIVYHYTDKSAYNAIKSQPSWHFKASRPPKGSGHPRGAYVTTLPPSTPKLATRLRIPARKTDYFFAMHIPNEQLRGIPGDRGWENKISLYYPNDLTVSPDNQISHGKRCK